MRGARPGAWPQASRAAVLSRAKAVAGILGVYICWVLLAWFCFAYGARAARAADGSTAAATHFRLPGPLRALACCAAGRTGELIYQLNSAKGPRDFPLSWLIALVTENCAQWQKVLQGAAETAVVLLVLDKLWLRSNDHWLESLLDTLSIQATLYVDAAQRKLGSAGDERISALQRAQAFTRYKAAVRDA